MAKKRIYTMWLPKDTEELKKAIPHCVTVKELTYVPYFAERKFGYCTLQRKVLEYDLKESLGTKTTPEGGDGKPVNIPPGVTALNDSTMRKIAEKFSRAELIAIANGVRFMPGQVQVPVIDFSGERIRFTVASDPHFGSLRSARTHWEQMVKETKKEKCEFVLVPGDVTNGMDRQKSPHYEQSHIGYAAQKKYAIEMMSMLPVRSYVVAGNHDLWYKMQNSAQIVLDICQEVKNCEYLGEHEGDINLKGKVNLKMWHGADGSSYALSYRLQKILESLTGGEKPHVLIAGHAHKALYIYERMVHTVSAGAMQQQTQWMRTKRLASHTGFWIIDIWVNKSGVAKFSPCWYPFYS